MIENCPTCKGHGYVEWFSGPNRYTEICNECEGDGEIETHGSFQHELEPDRLESDFAPRRGIQPPTFDIQPTKELTDNED